MNCCSVEAIGTPDVFSHNTKITFLLRDSIIISIFHFILWSVASCWNQSQFRSEFTHTLTFRPKKKCHMINLWSLEQFAERCSRVIQGNKLFSLHSLGRQSFIQSFVAVYFPRCSFESGTKHWGELVRLQRMLCHWQEIPKCIKKATKCIQHPPKKHPTNNP